MRRDVLVTQESSIVLFWPLTKRAKKWIIANVEAESWQLGPHFVNLAVEWRCAPPITEALQREGFNVEVLS